MIRYQIEKQNTKADALNRRPQDLPHGDDDERQKCQMQTLIPRENLDPQIRNELKLGAMINASLLDEIVIINQTDSELDKLR
jgi:hypothetical protein